MVDSSTNSVETTKRWFSWAKLSLVVSVLLWLLAWEAIVWFVPVQPWAVLRTSDRLMGFSADGKRLVTVNEQDTAPYPVLYHLWDVNTGQDLGLYEHEDESNLPEIVYSSQGQWEPPARKVGRAAFLSKAPNVYTLYDLTVRQRRAIQENAEDPGDDGPIDVCFATNGRTFAYSVCKEEGKEDLVVIDVATRQVRCHVKGGAFQGIILSPDDKTLAVFEIERRRDDMEPADVRLMVLDIATGKKQALVDSRAGVVNHVAFSPDGTKLAAHYWKYPTESEPEEINVRVWDVATGKEIACFSSDGYPEFLPDGKLALCNHDGLRLCDLASGQEFGLAHIQPQFGPEMCFGIYRALFAAPGTHLLAVRRLHFPTRNPWLQKYAAMLGMTWFSQEGLSEELAFVDTGTGEIVSSSIPCSKFIEPLMSPDGKTFALNSSENDEPIIEIWDFPPRKSPRWVIGLSAIPSLVTGFTLWKCARRGRHSEPGRKDSETAVAGPSG